MRERLKRLGMNKTELAERLGLNPKTVWDWGSSPPQYAEAYLDALDRQQMMRDQIKALLREWET